MSLSVLIIGGSFAILMAILGLSSPVMVAGAIVQSRARLVAGARVVSGVCSSQLSVACALASLVALPEGAARALGVIVGWGWSECLLLLVVADEENLPRSSDKEEEGSDDAQCEASGVQVAGIAEITSTWG